MGIIVGEVMWTFNYAPAKPLYEIQPNLPLKANWLIFRFILSDLQQIPLPNRLIESRYVQPWFPQYPKKDTVHPSKLLVLRYMLKGHLNVSDEDGDEYRSQKCTSYIVMNKVGLFHTFLMFFITVIII